MTKTIITCAITGGIHTPTMSSALPVTADAIAEQALGAAEAGAAILHLHARHPDNGAPSGKPEHYAAYLPRLKQATDAVLNITTGGSPSMTVEERIAAATQFSPEMCSLNMGSINFALHKLAGRYSEWKEDWEEPFLRGTEANIFRNTFTDIREISALLGGETHRIRFEHECYDVGHLYNLKFCLDNGFFQGPVFVQFVMGILGGIGADLENLLFLKKTADKLLGIDAYHWSVVAAGQQQMKLAAVAAQLGGNVRVGLEDSLYIARGKLAKSNAEQVEKIREILALQGNEVASPDEARQILGLKGADRTNIGGTL
ncbi:MAG: 3-keto-5-aminohexanoate cleavage protein [Pseudomonadota bacterium]